MDLRHVVGAEFLLPLADGMPIDEFCHKKPH
jgi:hypothetical protein